MQQNKTSTFSSLKLASPYHWMNRYIFLKISIFFKKENKNLYSSKAYIQMVDISILVAKLWLEAPSFRKNKIMRQWSKVLLILNASCNDSSRVTHLQSQVSFY